MAPSCFPTPLPGRRDKALENAVVADGLMQNCRLCAWDCGVDRTLGSAGKCNAGAHPRVFQERIEWVGEARLLPTRLVNFSGCNFRCSFCLTGRDSQDATRGRPFNLNEISAEVNVDAKFVRSLTIEGGETSIFLPDALRLAAHAPPGLPVVWKTNSFASDEALKLVEGCVDVFLADYKFGNDRCASKLAGVTDYLRHTQRNLRWANKNSSLIVRHLVMPGHVDCCTGPVLQWLARELPDVSVSLITGFLPLWNSRRTPELMSPLKPEELLRVRELENESGLTIEPWTVATPPPGYHSATEPADNNIYISPQGEIRVPYMSAELRKVFHDLEKEFSTAVKAYEHTSSRP